MPIVRVGGKPRVPRAQELLQNTGSNFLGLWTPEQNVKNLGASGHDGTLIGASIQQGALGPCINGANYRIQCASGDGDDIAGEWNSSVSTIVILGANYTGTCWVRGDNADYLYYHGSLITYVSPEYATVLLYNYSKVGNQCELFGRGIGSAQGPIAIGFISNPYGTCYVVSRDGRYASVSGGGVHMNNDPYCQYNFGSYFLDWGGSTARPTGELYGWMTWNRAMPLDEMQARLATIQRALDGKSCPA